MLATFVHGYAFLAFEKAFQTFDACKSRAGGNFVDRKICFTEAGTQRRVPLPPYCQSINLHLLSQINIRRLQRDLFPSEERGGDALKGFVLADAVHCEVSVTLVRLNYRPLSLCHL